jgi:hypothetical protein
MFLQWKSGFCKGSLSLTKEILLLLKSQVLLLNSHFYKTFLEFSGRTLIFWRNFLLYRVSINSARMLGTSHLRSGAWFCFAN